MGECLRARMCGTFARMVLMHTNVKIVSAVRSRPLIQVSFNGPYFSIIFWHFLFWNIIINVAKLSVCVQQKLAHKVMCHCAPSTGIVVCFALDPVNLLFNTSRAHSMKRIQLTDIARPKKHHLEWLRWNHSKSKPSSFYISSDQSHSVKTS